MSPARVRSARAAQVAASREAYRPGGKKLEQRKRRRVREGRRETKFVRTCPGSRAAEFGSCGRELRRIAASLRAPPSLPPSRRPRGRGGDVSAPPRPPPRGGDRGAPAGSASRTVAEASGLAGPASLPQRCLAVQTAERRPFSTTPRLPRRRRAPAPERPRGAHLSAGFLAGLLRPRFPRLQLQVMLFPFCR